MNRPIFSVLSALAALGPLLLACTVAGDGVKPNESAIYFPVALSVNGDAGNRQLAVLNSDFDLQFNRGTLQNLSLARLREIARTPCSVDSDCVGGERCDSTASEKNEGTPSYFCVATSGDYEGLPCGAFPVNTATTRGFSPGRCGPVQLDAPADDPKKQKKSLITDSLFVSAFGTDLLAVKDATSGKERLFVPIRGDASVEWINVEAGKFQCGQRSTERSCSLDYRVKSAEDVQVDNLQFVPKDGSSITVDSSKLPPEPYGIAASPDGQRIVLTHQNAVTGINITGRISAILNRSGEDPRFVSIQAGLALNPLGVASIPVAKADEGTSYEPGFLVTFRADPRVQLVRFYDDGALGAGGAASIEDARPFIRAVAAAPITLNSSGIDSRGAVVDDFERRKAEEACAGDPTCLAAAAEIPLEVYVANRSPASLLIGRTKRNLLSGESVDVPNFYENITLTEGPSRVSLGTVMTPQGKLERRVFVLCFDSSSIFVIDPARRVVESQFATGRGPQAIAFDPDKPVAYVAHFTDSYLGVISLNQKFPQTYGAMLAMLGTPTRPRASK